MDLVSEIQKIKRVVSTLEKTIVKQNHIIEKQSKKINLLSKEIESLKFENAELKERLHKKNSKNSSVPPSKDENRLKKTQSLRRSSGKKNGGQKGHPGDTLKMTENPDRIIKHIPSFCKRCGMELKEQAVYKQRRQTIDIPPILPVTTEHQVYSRLCGCGHCTVSDFPKGVKAPISYGSNVEALISYLSVRQYMSVNRIQEFLSQVTNLELSQGSICNKIKSFANKCLSVYDCIRHRIEQSKCVGSDETGFVVNGKKGWMWTWQTPSLTYIVASYNRGIKTIIDTFEKGLPLATLVHDCWRSHFNIKAKNHQLCLAHLRRELNYFIEKRKECWSYKFEKLLCKSLKLKKLIIEYPHYDYKYHIQQINKSADKLLYTKIDDQHKKLRTFKNKIIKYRGYLFPFLEDIHIPPDNNSSERAIRNVKVKKKVSGQFKTFDGATQFAVIRSVLDTCIKNDTNIFSTLLNIHILQPE